MKGLAGGFEAAGAAAGEEGMGPGPWLWQGGQWGAAAAEGGRRVNRLERTEGERHEERRCRCDESPAEQRRTWLAVVLRSGLGLRSRLGLRLGLRFGFGFGFGLGLGLGGLG